MSIVRANGIEFHIEDHGNGPPLVILHGFTGSAATWSSVMSDLASDRRVIAIDLVGHGASSAPVDPARYRFEQALQDLAEVTDAARSLPPEAWTRRGMHPTRGEMTVQQIFETFIARHLEEHADQLDSLQRAP